MDHTNPSLGPSPDDIFAEAAARIQAGESLESVVASYPARYQRNLADYLAIVATALEIKEAAVPPISAASQARRREAFLARARQLHADHQAIAPQRHIAAPRRSPTLAEQAHQLWGALERLFAIPLVRPAAAALAIVFLLLVSNTVVTLAEEAVPGDLSYPVKQWIRQQQLLLAPESERPVVRQQQEQELIQDLQASQEKADAQQIIIEAEGRLLFHGYGAGYLNIGNLRVLTRYQPDPNQLEFADMPIVGNLQPGATVLLRYRVLPGQAAAVGERVVQGVYLEVIRQQSVEPTPIPTETLLPPPPTLVPLPADCKVVVPPGWVPYNVKIGDTLSALAASTGVSSETLRATNCLVNGMVVANTVMLLPKQPPTPVPPTVTVEPTPAVEPTLAATVVITVVTTPATPPVATATMEPAPSATVETTPDVVPTVDTLPEVTPVITPTVDVALPTPEEMLTPVVTATDSVTTTQPVETASPETTPAPTVAETETTAGTETTIPDETSTPAPTSSGSDDLTPTPITTVDELATPAPTAEGDTSPTPASTVMEGEQPPTPTPTIVGTDAASATSVAPPVATQAPAPTTSAGEPPAAPTESAPAESDPPAEERPTTPPPAPPVDAEPAPTSGPPSGGASEPPAGPPPEPTRNTAPPPESAPPAEPQRPSPEREPPPAPPAEPPSDEPPPAATPEG
jgi:LysM repeat protein